MTHREHERIFGDGVGRFDEFDLTIAKLGRQFDVGRDAMRVVDEFAKVEAHSAYALSLELEALATGSRYRQMLQDRAIGLDAAFGLSAAEAAEEYKRQQMDRYAWSGSSAFRAAQDAQDERLRQLATGSSVTIAANIAQDARDRWHQAHHYSSAKSAAALAMASRANEITFAAAAQQGIEDELKRAKIALTHVTPSDQTTKATDDKPPQSDESCVKPEVIEADSSPIELPQIADQPNAMAPEHLGPPPTLEHLFWLILPASEREAILGDAEEAYHETDKMYGRSSAQFDYFKELIYAVAGRVVMFINRAARPFKSQ